ncbi:MAG: type II secretion system F family protein [Candidatus Diapherotrites archaeon]|nr:type II secretion system F family protein [Candidatus Diapherotrites archaeon]
MPFPQPKNIEPRPRARHAREMPFSFIPTPLLFAMAKPLRGVGGALSHAVGLTPAEFRQAGLEWTPEEYGSATAILVALYFVFGATLFFVVSLRAFSNPNFLLSMALGLIGGLLVFAQLAVYPRILIKKRVRELDRNLVFALRTILVQLRSGVSLFDSLKVVADGNFGLLSRQFKRAVDEIGTGVIEQHALEKLAENNPSLFFRRTIWQIVNGMRAGADVSVVLSESVDALTREQGIQIRKYESDMRLLSLVYMMLGVIIPALGITFLIVLSSFPQIQITEFFFWSLLGFVGVMQFMYLGIVKSKRPQLLGDS